MSRKLPKILDADECRAILDCFTRNLDSHHKNRAMIWTMLAGGLRVSEVSDLRPRDVDLNSGRIEIREGKGDVDRVVYVQGADALDALQRWAAERPTETDDGEACPFFFPTRTGGRTSERSIRRTVKRYARKVLDDDVADDVSPHTFRHTCLTRLYQQTRDIHLVQRFAGHASTDTTQIYVHLAADDVREQTVNFDPLDDGASQPAEPESVRLAGPAE